jgi:hypothetical protein
MSAMAARLSKLRLSLARHLNDESVEVEPYREGVDAYVDLVTRTGQQTAVVKTAKSERLLTSYGGLVDFGVVLHKEVAVARLLDQARVPVPTVLGWHRSDDPEIEPSWILSAFIPHPTRSELPVSAQTQLGRLARAIHHIEPSGRDLDILRGPASWSDWVVDRIMMRVKAAQRYVQLPSADDVAPALRRIVTSHARLARSLLHLDLRAPNIALRADDIVALFDYGNAIVGDPYFELARIRESGYLTEAFLDGYGLSAQELSAADDLLRAYGLDITALLVTVTREEFDDESLHAEMSTRTQRTIEWLASL